MYRENHIYLPLMMYRSAPTDEYYSLNNAKIVAGTGQGVKRVKFALAHISPVISVFSP